MLKYVKIYFWKVERLIDADRLKRHSRRGFFPLFGWDQKGAISETSCACGQKNGNEETSAEMVRFWWSCNQTRSQRKQRPVMKHIFKWCLNDVYWCFFFIIFWACSKHQGIPKLQTPLMEDCSRWLRGRGGGATLLAETDVQRWDRNHWLEAHYL